MEEVISRFHHMGGEIFESLDEKALKPAKKFAEPGKIS